MSAKYPSYQPHEVFTQADKTLGRLGIQGRHKSIKYTVPTKLST